MSICLAHVNHPEIIAEVLKQYRDVQMLSAKNIAQRLKITYHSVIHILRHHMDPHEFNTLKRLRYAATKMGDKNPMHGKTGSEHHNWQGDCEDGYGYLTRVHEGKRYFVHRIVMAEALGISPEDLPAKLVVHHIDGNPKNNKLNNLALCTNSGHKQIHERQVQDTESLKLKKSFLREAVRYMTSQ